MHEAALLLEDELLDVELLEDELLEDELLEELLEEDVELLSEPPPPHDAMKAAAPPDASQPINCRRCRSIAILIRSL